MTELRLTGVVVERGGAPVLAGVDLTVTTGELVAVLGANGAGKSTLLQACLEPGLVRAGSITLDGRPVATHDPLARARLLAWLPQQRPTAWPVRVEDLVALGRFAHGGRPARLDPADRSIVEQCLADCELLSLRHRTLHQLSGGECTRVHVARAFATRAALLLADEPTTALDPRQQLRVARLLRAHVDAGHGVLMTTHEPALVARHADRLVWLRAGRIFADGPPAETLTDANLATAYDIDARVSWTPAGPALQVLGPVSAAGSRHDAE